jgi:hypothetical protein
MVGGQVFQRFQGDTVLVVGGVGLHGLGVEIVGFLNCHRPAFAGHGHRRDVAGDFACSDAAVAVGGEVAQEALQARLPHQHFQVVQAGRHRNHRLQPTVVCADVNHVDTAQRDTPPAHVVLIDFGLCAQPRNGVANVLLLVVRVEMIARHAVAAAVVAIVEHQHHEPGGAEALGVARQGNFLDRADRVRHDDGRSAPLQVVRHVQPTPALNPLAGKSNISPHLFLS